MQRPPYFSVLVVAVLAGLAAAGCAPALAAPPHLIASWPLDGASLPIAVHTLDLTFNRALRPESTWAEVWRDEDGSQMPTSTVIEPANPRRLMVRLQQPAGGHYRLHWHAVAARTAAAADGEQEFLLQDESTGAPHVAMSQPSANSGDRVEVKGNGFGKRSAITLTIGDDAQALNTVETDAHGSFGADVRIPPGVPFGVQPVAATDGNGGLATTAVQVRWGGWPPVVAYTAAQAGPGPGEVTFTISLRNRSDFLLERVRVVLDDPPSEATSFVAAGNGPGQTSVRQERTVVWEIPMLDRGVVGPFQATYRVTGAVASHTRIEFRHRRPRGCTADDCPPAFISETTSDSTPVSPAD